MKNIVTALACLLALPAPLLAAQPTCSAPQALFERFTSADCEACWQDAATPAPGDSALVLDWIVPGRLGDEAPLAAAATRDALARLETLGRAAPATTDVHTDPVTGGPGQRLRGGLGPAVNDYVGTTLTWATRSRAPAWTFHLLLVEHLPAGAEGTAVSRNLVRNMLEGIWGKRQALSKNDLRQWMELRPMRIPDGARPERLHTVGWVQDDAGRVVAAAQSGCR